MKFMFRCFIWLFVFLVVATVLIWTCLIVPGFFWALEPIAPEIKKIVFIPRGLGTFEIAQLLVKEGIEKDPYRPAIMVFALRWNTKLKSGEYAFNFPMSHLEVWEKIVRGDVVRHFVTIVEGATIFDVAEVIDKTGIATKDEIIRKARDRHFIHSLGFDDDISSLEGYLFPATYNFTKKDTPETILKRMVTEFKRRFKPEWIQQTKNLNFSVHQIITLASMVEKEAVKDEERPVIAGVFINRLKIGMPLQSDPTAVYDLENYRGPVLRSHLDRRSPYNTYVIKGLPPGPICNPGLASIKAVLFPADVKYLYFVSDRKGSHRFSTTYEEHLQAIKEIAASMSKEERKD